MKESVLHFRLSNCLQTILELEGDLERLQLGHVLLSEFSQLREFMDRIEMVEIDEDDVRRIEAATANFLEELQGPLGLPLEGEGSHRLVQ